MSTCQETIIVNGTKMLLSDYRKQKRSQMKATSTPKKKVQVISEVKLLSSDIQSMVSKVRLIKSLSAYYDNAYRQWGNIGKKIINLKEVRKPFVMFRCKVREISHTMDMIVEDGKKNKKSVYQLIRKLSYQLDDLKDCMSDLFSGVSKSCIVQRYAEHEAICGFKKRLGLKELMSRSMSASRDLNDIIKKFQIMSDRL